MVQEARARAVHPKSKTAAIYKAVLRRGYKGAKSDAAPRVYVYNAVGAPKPVVWPRGSRALGERASARIAPGA